MKLEERLFEDMGRALKEGEKLKLSVLRLVRAAIKNREIELKKTLSDDEAIQVLSSLSRRYIDSIESYKKGGRMDLVEKEEKELAILKEYLPEQLSQEELEVVISSTIEEANASTTSHLGKVMAELMPKVRGRVDGRVLSRMVKERLTQRRSDEA